MWYYSIYEGREEPRRDGYTDRALRRATFNATHPLRLGRNAPYLGRDSNSRTALSTRKGGLSGSSHSMSCLSWLAGFNPSPRRQFQPRPYFYEQ